MASAKSYMTFIWYDYFIIRKQITVNGREVLKVIAVSMPFNKASKYIVFDLLPVLNDA
jgi:hypothetical protein